MLGILLLALSTTLAAVAILRRMEVALLVAVAAYAGTAVYIIEAEFWLLPATLLAALAIGLMAVLRLLFGRPRQANGAADAFSFFDGG